MPKAKLDHMFAATAQCEPGKAKTDWYDETITGFVLECRSSGGKTYYLLRIHDLRHSAASFMVNGGIDLFAVGKVLGHASVQSTQRYSHLANDTLLKAVEAGAAKQKAA